MNLKSGEMAIVLPNRQSGVPEIFHVDVNSLRPGSMPQGLVGPFLLEFNMDDGRGAKKFHGNVMMNSSRCIAAFQVYPIVARVKNDWGLQGKVAKILETGRHPDATTNDRVMGLKASLFGKTHIWIELNRGIATGGMWNEKDQTCWSLPFYNFYNDGRTCLGGLEGILDSNPLRAIYQFLGAYTTPHQTFIR